MRATTSRVELTLKRWWDLNGPSRVIGSMVTSERLSTMANDPFSEATQNKPIVRALRNKLTDNEFPGNDELFWESEEDRFVSGDSLKEGADPIAIILTRDQWRIVFGWFPVE